MIGIGNVENDVYVAETAGKVRKFDGESGTELPSSFTLSTGISYSDVHTVTPATGDLGTMYIFTESESVLGSDQRVYIYAPDSTNPNVDKVIMSSMASGYLCYRACMFVIGVDRRFAEYTVLRGGGLGTSRDGRAAHLSNG